MSALKTNYSPMDISGVKFSAATPEEKETGLLGWCSYLMGGTVQIDGVAVRRTADGRRALSFPARRDGQGRQHAYVKPLDDQARREIEAAVFSALGMQ